MERLISHAEAMAYLGIPPHAQAGFLSAGAEGVSDKTIRRTLAGHTDPRTRTAGGIQRAAMQAYSQLAGIDFLDLTDDRVKEIRRSPDFEWLLRFERAVAALIEQEAARERTGKGASDRLCEVHELVQERIRLVIFLLAGFEVASAKKSASITLYWCDLLPRRDERHIHTLRLPMWCWFQDIRTQVEKGSVLVGIRAAEARTPMSFFDSIRYFNELPQDPDQISERGKERVLAKFQPASTRRVHKRRLPYATVERELGLAPKQASRWANASRVTDLPGWKALLSVNQRMSRMMPPGLRERGPNLPVSLLVARFLHAFCLDCLARGASQSMLEQMEASYAEAAGAWVRYYGEGGGQNPLLADCPPPG